MREHVRTIILLHEIGHVASTYDPSYIEQFGVDNSAYDVRLRRDMVRALFDECVAWNYAHCFAKALGVKFDEKCFSRLRTNCMMAHLRWWMITDINILSKQNAKKKKQRKKKDRQH